MVKFFQVIIVILAGISVAIADFLIKKAAIGSTMANTFKNPLILLVYALYFAQIYFFAYVFIRNWKLGIVGVLQMVFYTITILALGYFYFHEQLSTVQFLGILLALMGVILMNL